MRFQRYGRSFQMLIQNGKDLEEVLNLDEALWGALSAPKDVFSGDPRFYQLMDRFGTGRITIAEVKQAIRWMLDNLVDHEAIQEEFSGALPLSAISLNTPVGRALVDSSKYMLAELRASSQTEISLEQVREFLTTVLGRSLNGDGVLTAQAAADDFVTKNPRMKELLEAVVKCTGGTKDIGGSIGMTQANLDAFLAACKEHLDWMQKGAIPSGETVTTIMCLGKETPACAALVRENAPLINAYFQLCRLLEFDNRIEANALSPEKRAQEFDPAQKAAVASYQQTLPLAVPRSSCILPLDMNRINPAYSVGFGALLEKVLYPLLGEDATGMTQTEWNMVLLKFAPYEKYLSEEAGGIVHELAPEALTAFLGDGALREEAAQLMARDKQVADTITAAREVERLLLYRANLLRFTNNFVCFSELYATSRHALFECGKVVIDGRWFGVVLKVSSVSAHQSLGKVGQLFLMYMDIVQNDGKKSQVVVPVTNGTKGTLAVGKHGIFYDFDGKDYDAVITQLQVNPICIGEALLSPFARMVTIVENKIAAWSSASEKQFDGKFTEGISKLPATPKNNVNAGKNSNPQMLVGISVAFAALGSAFAFISKTISSMNWLQILTMILGALLVVMVPIAVIACVKLFHQDLSSLLEGCGWGVNLRLRLDLSLRRQFTYFGKYPEEAKGTPRSYWLSFLLWSILVILLIIGGHRWWAAHQVSKKACEQKCTPCVQTVAPVSTSKTGSSAPLSEKK